MLKGAEIIAMPICYSTYADPARRASIWDVPLRARAYENGVFVLASNRVGIEGPGITLAAAWSSTRAAPFSTKPGTEHAELLVAQIDLDDVVAARKKFPWWRDRRPDLYAPLVHVD